MRKINSINWRSEKNDRPLLIVEGTRIFLPAHEITRSELEELGQAVDQALRQLYGITDLQTRTATPAGAPL